MPQCGHVQMTILFAFFRTLYEHATADAIKICQPIVPALQIKW